MKLLKQLTCILLLGMLISSCNENKSNVKTETSETPKPKIDTTFTIDTFTILPKEIDGCSCTFSSTQGEWKKKNYVYAGDDAKLAFVKINGKQVTFTLTETKEISKFHNIQKFDNNEFELIIETEKTGTIDETIQQEGTLKITNKATKVTLTKNIVGECGC